MALVFDATFVDVSSRTNDPLDATTYGVGSVPLAG